MAPGHKFRGHLVSIRADGRGMEEVRTVEEYKEKSILDLITEHAVNERLDALLFCDPDFLALQEKVDEETEVFDSLGLPREVRQAVERLISAYTESAAYHSAAAYRLGLKDCAAMLDGIGLVKGIGPDGSA